MKRQKQRRRQKDDAASREKPAGMKGAGLLFSFSFLRSPLSVLFYLFSFLSAFPAAAQQTPEAPGRHEAIVAGDYFGAGGNLAPSAAVEGDAFISGGQVLLQTPVGGDAVMSGGSVTVSAPVGDDLYVAGGTVLLESNVAGNARVAGHRVDIAKSARINGKTTIAARTVHMAGRVGHQLSVAAYSVVLDGEVSGNVTVAARKLTVGPSARIVGKLTFRGPGEPAIDPGAVIGGGVNHADSALDDDYSPFSRAAGWAMAIAFTFGLFFLGLVGILAAPFATAKVGMLARSRQFASLGMGLAMILLMPVAAAVLAMTVVGLPVAFVLMLMWPLMLVFGYLAGVLSITDAIAGASRKKLPGNGVRVFLLALGLAGMLAFCTVPVIGWALGVLLTVAGVGAMTLEALGERFPSRVREVELRSDEETVFRREPTLRF